MTDKNQEIDLQQLETEGDFAADYIEGLLDIADLDGDLDLKVANNRAHVAITGGGSDLEPLAMPNVVRALQDLTRLAVQKQTGDFSGLILDVAGSREARMNELHKMADAALTALKAGQAEVSLERLSSYERKIVHDYVAEKGFVSNSYGEGKFRKLVVTALAE